MDGLIFKTDWGWMGLAGQGRLIKAVVLPSPERRVTEDMLQLLAPGFSPRPDFLPGLQNQLQSFFRGQKIEEWDCAPDLSPYTRFQSRVLRTVLSIPHGTVKTYGQVAAECDCPRGMRAVGQALARNRTPLLIPCHRVLGLAGWGGFTAPGGVEMKKALLNLEGVHPSF